MAYNYINRFNADGESKHPFLLAICVMLLVMGFGLTIVFPNQLLFQLMEWICSGIVLVFLSIGFLNIFFDK